MLSLNAGTEGNVIMLKRKSYARIKEKLEIPDLLRVQKESYDSFLQQDVPPNKRKKEGLHGAFQNLFPISDVKGYFKLEYVNYKLGVPKYSLEESKQRGMTYAAPLKVDLAFSTYDVDGKEQKFIEKVTNEVYIGEIPLMTERGTFVINGAERVIVSQLHRSPGITFDEDKKKSSKTRLTARIIPQRGSWVELLLDSDDVLWINIDRRKKMPVTVMLRALGYSLDEDIISLFHTVKAINLSETSDEEITGKMVVETVFDRSTGEVVADTNEMLTADKIKELRSYDIQEIKIVDEESSAIKDILRNTFAKDATNSENEAILAIYETIRPGPPPNIDNARNTIKRLFFDERRYDLGEVGRLRLNDRLGVTHPEEKNTLCVDDFTAAIKYIIKLDEGEGYLDDIDHLGNRRVRSVGELLETQFSVGLARMSRTIRERLSVRDNENLVPQDLINARTVSTVIQAFFGSSQLSQFLDQTNPLSELTHKRRVSALGPGGLTRERAGFEVRDVHHTHYGRLCPIETPEGPNIGLIASLSIYAGVNSYGFIETPYVEIKDNKVTDNIVYLTADQEDQNYIVQRGIPLDEKGCLRDQHVIARFRGDFPVVPAEKVTYMDISPRQIVSVSAGAIPFLEHDDANRALMGSNMQRQAVPLLTTEVPYAATGMERKAAEDSGSLVKANTEGVVSRVEADRVFVKKDQSSDLDSILGLTQEEEYSLIKFQRSNQDTCINQKVCVKPGTKVQKGSVLADGHAIDQGELALGRNVMVAYMPWRGYNFEDAIVVSEKLVEDDVYTSLHIEVFETEVRDTKRGPEELTREIPNVGERALKDLDENGVVRVGTRVESGDILVGKVTPKGETELSPEERLLRAVFGEKAEDVKDSSLKAPPGLNGIVIDAKVYSRKERDKQSRKRDKERIEEIKSENGKKIKEVEERRNDKLLEILKGSETKEVTDGNDGSVYVPPGRKWKKTYLNRIHDFTNLKFEEGLSADEEKSQKAEEIIYLSNDIISKYEDRMHKEIDKILRGDELKPGVVQLVKVYVAKKRKLSVGDKMAGRHGNKGVISRVVPKEDMPFMPDGTPIDMVLNPLGVPSRMNVGQIFETHIGWAAKVLGEHYETPVFDGASYQDILENFEKAGLPQDGKAKLRDGVTGKYFESKVTVGAVYMLKLCHLVDDKIHARSIGPYSLVTQQPLGGKSQFGGQRFGEMEVWALEAYGAAYTLQQMLTVKSDDVKGRSRIYEAIVKGENTPKSGIPESFNVLIREIKSLGMDIELLTGDEPDNGL